MLCSFYVIGQIYLKLGVKAMYTFSIHSVYLQSTRSQHIVIVNGIKIQFLESLTWNLMF